VLEREFWNIKSILARAIEFILEKLLELIILLGGGSKKQQNKDIYLAKQKWNEYKQRKKR